MTQRRFVSRGSVLIALASAACSDGGEDGTGGVGGQMATATAGSGNSGSSGAATGSAGLGGGGSGGAGGAGSSGGTAMAGRGGDGTGDDHLDQQVREASDTCLYSFVRIAVAGGGDTALETSVDSAIKMASYDRSSGTKFIIDTHDGHHVELTWQPPASKPDIVDFSGLLKYTAQGGNMRSLCVMGRMLDAFQYPVENYFPFVATTGVEATAAGECTTSAVSVTISGCVSEGYNIR